MKKLEITHYFQTKIYTCGLACVRMVVKYYGKDMHEHALAERVLVTKKYGTSRRNLLRLLQSVGLRARVKRFGSLGDITLALERGMPVIVNYKVTKYEQDHYGIIKGLSRKKVFFADPSRGKNYALTRKEFLHRWKNQKLRKKYTGWMVVVAPKRRVKNNLDKKPGS